MSEVVSSSVSSSPAKKKPRAPTTTKTAQSMTENDESMRGTFSSSPAPWR